MHRFRKAWPAAVVMGLVAVAAPLLAGSTANAVGTQAGAIDISPDSGDSATNFTVTLPAGAACTGDTANSGYAVGSYMVPADVDPATLTFDGAGPIPFGLGADLRVTLFDVATSQYIGVATIDQETPNGPGLMLQPPAPFNLSVFAPGDVPAGVYNVGLACYKGPAGPDQLDKFWNTKMTITANPAGGPAQIDFVEGAVPDAPVLDSLEAGPGQLTATFTPGESEPAATGYTVTADDGINAPITATGPGSPIVVGGLTDGTEYDVTVHATNATGDSAESNVLSGTPGDFVAPDAPTVTITDPIDASNVTAVEVSGSGEDGTTADITVDDANGATAAVTTSAVVSGGTYSATGLDVSGLDDGTITATVTLTDAASNVSAPASDTATKDTVPAAPAVDLPNVNASNLTAVTVSGTGEDGTADITVDDNDGGTAAITTTAVVTGGAFSATLDLSTLTDGPLTATVTITNSIGNTGPAGTDTATKDTIPDAPTVTLPAINANNVAAVTVSGSGENGTANISVDDDDPETAAITTTAAVVNGEYSATLDLTTLSDGPVTATVSITNELSNTGPEGTATVQKRTVPAANPFAPLLAQLQAAYNSLIAQLVALVQSVLAQLQAAFFGLRL